jgi:hypothetical protein
MLRPHEPQAAVPGSTDESAPVAIQEIDACGNNERRRSKRWRDESGGTIRMTSFKQRTPRSAAHCAGAVAATFLFVAAIATVATQCAWADTATVTVNTGTVDATVPAAGYGMNTAVFDNDLIDSSLPGLMSADGITALRFPGGSDSDGYHWATNTSTPYVSSVGTEEENYVPEYINSDDTFQNWMSTVVLPLGAHPIITVNYGSSAAGTGGGSPSEAASWVQYANVTNSYNITYWEIGNEVYGNGYYGDPGWELDLHYPNYNGQRAGQSALSPTSYGTNALAYISAMKAVDSAIKCGVVLTAYGNWPDGVSPDWNTNVLEECGTKIDFVILHWYPGGSTAAAALAYPSTIASIVSATRAEINEYCGSNASNVQILVTETNDLTSGQTVWTDTSMFAGDDYLSWFEQGIQNVDWWNLHQTYLANSVSGVANNTQDAEYWGIKMATLAARPGDSLVSSSSSNSLLRVHATHRSDGSVGILLMNEDPSNSDTVSVSVSGTTLTTTGTQYVFAPSNFGSTAQYTTDGPAESSVSGVGNSFSVTVPAYTEELLIIPASSGGGGGNLIANGTYTLVGLNSGMALDDPNSSTTAGEDMNQLTVDGGNNQAWVLTNLGGNVVTLKNVASGQMLDVAGASKTAGALVDQWPGNGQTNQEWTIAAAGTSGYYTLESVNSGLMLDVVGASKTSGAGIDQWTANGQTNQEWKFQAP